MNVGEANPPTPSSADQSPVSEVRPEAPPAPASGADTDAKPSPSALSSRERLGRHLAFEELSLIGIRRSALQVPLPPIADAHTFTASNNLVGLALSGGGIR